MLTFVDLALTFLHFSFIFPPSNLQKIAGGGGLTPQPPHPPPVGRELSSPPRPPSLGQMPRMPKNVVKNFVPFNFFLKSLWSCERRMGIDAARTPLSFQLVILINSVGRYCPAFLSKPVLPLTFPEDPCGSMNGLRGSMQLSASYLFNLQSYLTVRAYLDVTWTRLTFALHFC